MMKSQQKLVYITQQVYTNDTRVETVPLTGHHQYLGNALQLIREIVQQILYCFWFTNSRLPDYPHPYHGLN